jgi:hypothetical protein
MGKVKDRFGERSLLKVNPLAIGAIDQNQIWVHNDDEADSTAFFLPTQSFNPFGINCS